MIEYPPILRGTAEEQLAALRDYLVRRARSENETQSGGASAASAAEALRRAKTPAREDANVSKLRALIVKTAQRVEAHTEELRQELHADYLAVSDFGSYREELEAAFSATARGVVESYGFESALEAQNAALGSLTASVRSIEGEIRRGFITDPETGETAFGIAIGEKLRFTGATVTENGVEYATLSPGQTLGLYTSTGWQFWINGSKRGWFDSRDGDLHVANLAAESGLRLGADWLMSAAGGFGLRYMGGTSA